MPLKPNNDRVISRIAARTAQISPMPVGFYEMEDGTPVAVFDDGSEIQYDFSAEPLYVLRAGQPLDPDSPESNAIMDQLADVGLQYLQSEDPRRLARKAQMNEIVGQFDLYWPVEDWAGMGYPHWMIVHDWTPGIGGGGNSHSGTGHTLDEAAEALILGMGICEGGCNEFTITEQDAIGRALEGQQFGKEEFDAQQSQ